MWLRLFLLVTVAVGLNWAIAEQIKKQHTKQGCVETIESKGLYSTNKMIAMHRRDCLQRRL